MEPVYSDWKCVITPDNKKELYYCPRCERPISSMMHRYVTDRNGEREEQFRIECPICNGKGKTYLSRTIAIQSWSTGEHIPPPLIKVVQRGRSNAK